MMIPVSIVSRKTMKKIGTANTLGMAMGEALGRVGKGRFALERLQSLLQPLELSFTRSEKMAELDRRGII
jgi:hypothetical protein